MLKTKNLKIIILICMPFIAYTIAHFLINHHPETICIWKTIFHKNCWGCGITRAFYSLCKLKFEDAWNYNPRIYIVAPLLLYIWLKELYKNLKQ